MRLFESILETNQRRVAGATDAVVPAAEFAGALPIAALSCIDPRLNHLLPDMLGIAEEHFIWLRNAGNIITSPLSSTMRSLSLACAVKGAKEIVVIGHTDCQVCKTSTLQLLEKFSALGVDRHKLPENLVEYFGLFSSERQNVMRGVEFVRASPLIGAKVPVHGLLIDIKTGKLDWVVNGYEAPASAAVVSGKAGEMFRKADQTLDSFARIGNAAAEELKLPEAKIGEVVSIARDVLQRVEQVAAAAQNSIGSHGTAAKIGATATRAVSPTAASVPASAAGSANASAAAAAAATSASVPPALPPTMAAPAAMSPADKLRLLAKVARDAKAARRK